MIKNSIKILEGGIKSLLTVEASFCHIPLGLPVNLWITDAQGQKCILLDHCVLSVSVYSLSLSLYGAKFHFLKCVHQSHCLKPVQLSTQMSPTSLKCLALGM